MGGQSAFHCSERLIHLSNCEGQWANVNPVEIIEGVWISMRAPVVQIWIVIKCIFFFLLLLFFRGCSWKSCESESERKEPSSSSVMNIDWSWCRLLMMFISIVRIPNQVVKCSSKQHNYSILPISRQSFWFTKTHCWINQPNVNYRPYKVFHLYEW